MKNSESRSLIDVKDMPLEEWLELVFNPPSDSLFCNYSFPTDHHHDEYISTIDQRTDKEVKRLLYHFLIPSGSLGTDQTALEWLLRQSDDEGKRLLEFQYYRRLLLYSLSKKNAPPWEGMTWILDLLPHFPKDALEGLNAYKFAHIQFLPDGRIHGLYDAAEVIRAKFIGMPGTRSEAISFLKALSSRDFEHLVECLYHAIGYETQLTPPSKDGGRDILAKKLAISQREQLLIECKKYEHPVEVKIVRSLMGVVSSEKVNKGVVVTTSRFTRGAKDFANVNPRLELINGDELVGLLNEHLGPKWSLKIDRLITESQRRNKQD